jgi:hypothetical protein
MEKLCREPEQMTGTKERLKNTKYYNDPEPLPLNLPLLAEYIGVDQQSRIVLEVEMDTKIEVDSNLKLHCPQKVL